MAGEENKSFHFLLTRFFSTSMEITFQKVMHIKTQKGFLCLLIRVRRREKKCEMLKSLRNENLFTKYMLRSFSFFLFALLLAFFAESIHVRWISISRYISPRVTFNLTANIFLKSSCIFFHSSKNPHPHPPTCAPNVTFLVACTLGRIIFHVFSPPRISSNCLHLYEKKAKTYRRFVEEQVNIRICELRSMKNCRKIEILIPPSCFLSWLLLQFLHLSLIPICLLLLLPSTSTDTPAIARL